MLNRRTTLLGAATLPAIPLFAEPSASIKDKLTTSQLIYLTPIKSDGSESTCKGEVWFLYQDPDIWVVTQADAWRAEAIRKRLPTARIWIGEFGQWQSAGDSYRAAPELMVYGAQIEYQDKHATIIDQFGPKYSAEWDVWGPRWKTSLADGSRVLLRYRVI